MDQRCLLLPEELCFNFVQMDMYITYIVDKSTGFSDIIKIDENWVNAKLTDCANTV